MTAPRASLVIPSLGRQAFLLETAQRFLAFPFADWELILVDQTPGASTALADLERQRPGQVRYLHLQERGLPNARNLGIRQARGEIVAFVDDDVVPHDGFLAAHLEPYANPEVGGVAGRVLETVPRPKILARSGPVGGVRRLDGRITRGFDTLTPLDVDFAPGGNMSFRRSVLVEVGGFDRRFGGTAHLEETDLGLRVRARGWRLRFAPPAAVTHLSLQVGGCRELDLASWLYWYGHNYMLFARRNLPAAFFPVFLAERLAKLLYTAARSGRPRYLTRGVAGLIAGAAASRAPQAPL